LSILWFSCQGKTKCFFGRQVRGVMMGIGRATAFTKCALIYIERKDNLGNLAADLGAEGC
jgi:hypothetical protein